MFLNKIPVISPCKITRSFHRVTATMLQQFFLSLKLTGNAATALERNKKKQEEKDLNDFIIQNDYFHLTEHKYLKNMF